MPLVGLLITALSVDPTLVLVPVSQAATTVAEPGAAPPVKLWINSGRQFREGDQAQVQVETRDDGYLIVFNYDTDGRLRVLFPIDPRDDAMVQGGRRYEIRGRADRGSFLAGGDGSGLVYAAISADPFRVDEIAAAGNWDYTRLNLGRDSRDAEADITDILQKITTDRGFDYDVLDYRVYGYRDRYVASSMWYPRSYGYWDDYYCDSGFRVSLFGCRYYPGGGWYLGSGYGYGGYGYGGYRGYGYGGWYDPWYYGGGRGGYTNGYYRNTVLAGRPRGYSIVRRDGNHNGAVGRSGPFGSFGGGSLGGGSRPAGDYRPRSFDGRRPGEVGGVRPSVDGVARMPDLDRPRGRRVNPPEDRGPIVERDRGRGERGPVDFGGGRARGPERQPEVQRERPRDNDRPRANPPRNDAPRRDPPPSSAPRNNGGGGGGGGSHRPHRP